MSYYITFCAYRNGIISQIFVFKSLLWKGIISALCEIYDLILCEFELIYIKSGSHDKSSIFYSLGWYWIVWNGLGMVWDGLDGMGWYGIVRH